MQRFKTFLQEQSELKLGRAITPDHQLITLDNKTIAIVHHQAKNSYSVMIKGTQGFKPFGRFPSLDLALEQIRQKLRQDQKLAAIRI